MVLYSMLLALPAKNKEGNPAYFTHYYVEDSRLYGLLNKYIFFFNLDTFHGIWEHVEPRCIFFPEICHSSKRPWLSGWTSSTSDSPDHVAGDTGCLFYTVLKCSL